MFIYLFIAILMDSYVKIKGAKRFHGTHVKYQPHQARPPISYFIFSLIFIVFFTAWFFSRDLNGLLITSLALPVSGLSAYLTLIVLPFSQLFLACPISCLTGMFSIAPERLVATLDPQNKYFYFKDPLDSFLILTPLPNTPA